MKKLLFNTLIFTLSFSIMGFSQSAKSGTGKNFQGLIGIYKDPSIKDPTYAIHPNLPAGTKLEVHNFANGKTATVKVSGAGNIRRGRVLEVSEEMAKKLGFFNEGIAYSSMEVLEMGKGILEPEEEPEEEPEKIEPEKDIKTDYTPQQMENIEKNTAEEPAPIKVPRQTPRTVVNIQNKPARDQSTNTYSKTDNSYYADNSSVRLEPPKAEEKQQVENNTKAVKKVTPEKERVVHQGQKMNVNRIFVIQFGAFSTLEKARAFQQVLAKQGIQTYYAQEGKRGDELYKIRESAIYRDLQEVFSKVLEYKKAGYKDCFAVGKFFVSDTDTQ